MEQQTQTLRSHTTTFNKVTDKVTDKVTNNSIPFLDLYMETFTPKELQGYHIAKSHLGSTFSLEKSNGFIEWKEKFTKTLG
jgi:hypothetical protein